MRIAVVPHGSPEYWQTVELRREVLRRPLGLDFTAEELARETDDLHFGAFEDGACVGCLVLTAIDASTFKMRQVAVLPGLQGKGIGRKLVRACEEFAQSQSRPWIRLHARESAVPFYKRLGYCAEGPQFEEVGIPHRAMAKRVPL